MSNGTPPKRFATPTTSGGATNRKTAWGSTNRRISQGQAMRSIFGRARVTHTVRPRGSTGGSFAKGTNGRPACLHPSNPAVRVSAETPRSRSNAAAPWLKLEPVRQIKMAAEPPNLSGQSSNSLAGPWTEEGTRCGSASNSSCGRTSTSVGHFGVPISLNNLSMEIVVGADTVRPFSCEERNAMLQPCASWGDRESP